MAFLKTVPPGSLVGDLGCGNGKYFWDVQHASGLSSSPTKTSESGIRVVGSDRCRRLLELARERSPRLPNNEGSQAPLERPECVVADVTNSPYRSGVFDFTLNIAVSHLDVGVSVVAVAVCCCCCCHCRRGWHYVIGLRPLALELFRCSTTCHAANIVSKLWQRCSESRVEPMAKVSCKYHICGRPVVLQVCK